MPRKEIQFIIVMALFGLYTAAVCLLFPSRWSLEGHSYTGLSGWELGALFLLIIYFMSAAFLVPGERNLFFASSRPGPPGGFTKSSAAVLNGLLMLSVILIMLGTQMQQSVFNYHEPHGGPYGFFWGLFEERARDLIWNLSGLPVFSGLLLLGYSVYYCKARTGPAPGEDAWNAWSYSFWMNFIVGATGWMFITWLVWLNGDPHMAGEISSHRPYGYFAVGDFAVAFSSRAELYFMFISSAAASIAAFGVIQGKFRRYPLSRAD